MSIAEINLNSQTDSRKRMFCCNGCKIEKESIEFSVDRRSKSGLQSVCKSCYREYQRINKEQIKEYKKKHYKANKVELDSKMKEYYQANWVKLIHKMKEYRITHKEQKNNYEKEYTKIRRQTDSLYRLMGNLRSLIYISLKNKGYTKRSKTQKLLGADFKTVQTHLVNSAIKNYGSYDPAVTYHIDHIIPCKSATTEDQLIALQYYTNLQYLTVEDNLAKSSKLNWDN